MQRQKEPKRADTKSKKTLNNKAKPNINKAQQEFKKRYFEYYDDIKISDRQDW